MEQLRAILQVLQLFFYSLHLLHTRLLFLRSDHYFEFMIILIRDVADNGYSHGSQYNIISSDN